jgi:amino acid adenylation domain-containing protein
MSIQWFRVVYVVVAAVMLLWLIVDSIVIWLRRRVASRSQLVSESSAESTALEVAENGTEDVAQDRLPPEEWTGLHGREAGPCVRMEQLLERAPPESVALVAPNGKAITYADFKLNSAKVAAKVWKMQKTDPRRCGIYAERSAEMLYGIMGSLMAHCAYVPLGLKFPVERLAYIIEDGNIGVVLTTKKMLLQVGQFASGIPCLNVSDAITDDEYVSSTSSEVVSCSPDDTVVIFYTSGSTGKPKGVELSHRAEATIVLDYADKYIKRSDKVLFQTTYTFDVSFTEIFSTFASSATLVIAPDEIELLQDTLDQQKPDVMSMVPSVFSVFVSQFGMPSARTISLAGEALPAKLWMDMHQSNDGTKKHLNAYGPTECSVYATIFGPSPMLDLVNKLKAVPIGKPCRWRECYIMATEGAPVQVNQGTPGELWLAGAGLAKGYVNLLEKTAQSFVPHPLMDAERAYRTGDLCKWLSNGDILYMGRIDHQVKLRGLRIELGEIEHVLREESSVTEAVVVKHEPKDGAPFLVAYVSPDTAEVRSALTKCQAALPSYMVPSSIQTLAEWPRNAAGKIDRVQLSKKEAKPDISSADASAGEAEVLDSLQVMRRINQEGVARLAHMQALQGFVAVGMTLSHWGLDGTRFSVGAFPGILDQLHVSVFIFSLAFTNAISKGPSGTSDAFRFTVHDVALIVFFFLWQWPFPEIQAALLQLLTGDGHYDVVPPWNAPDSITPWHTRWFILNLIVAKAVTVVLNKTRVSINAQVFGMFIVWAYFAQQQRWTPFPVWPAFEGPFFYGMRVYIQNSFFYLVSVHYHPIVWQYCAKAKQLFLSLCFGAKCLSEWLVWAFAVILLIIVQGLYYSRFDMFIPQNLLSVPLMILAIPNIAPLRWLGRHVLGIFFTHRHLQLVVQKTGISVYGVPVIPNEAKAIESVRTWAGGIDWLSDLLAVFVIVVYSVVFCCTISAGFQLIIMHSLGKIASLSKSIVSQVRLCFREKVSMVDEMCEP